MAAWVRIHHAAASPEGMVQFRKAPRKAGEPSWTSGFAASVPVCRAPPAGTQANCPALRSRLAGSRAPARDGRSHAHQTQSEADRPVGRYSAA